MKTALVTMIATVAFISCQNPKNVTEEIIETADAQVQYLNFGDSTFDINSSISAADLAAKMNVDTLWAVVAGPITQVCEVKGCWMSTKIDDESNLFIDYDYEFLLPTNSQGQDMVMTGYAFWDTTSVAQLRHYAEDRGATEEEIAAITEPKAEMRFKAKGVKIIIPEGSMEAETSADMEGESGESQHEEGHEHVEE